MSSTEKNWIKNSSLLARTDLRRDALLLAETALTAIDTKAAMNHFVRLTGDNLRLGKNLYELGKIRRLFLCGVGKCALGAAIELEKLLGSRINGGVVIGLTEDNEEHYFNYYRGTHPLPSEANIKATSELIHLFKEMRSEDLVIFIVSGGGSTLLCQPAKNGISLADEQAIMIELQKGGATIQEVNMVRKHLSVARGGWLAEHCYPAQVASLIFSDVAGDQTDMVASGPLEYDLTNVHQADFILDKYEVRQKVPVNFDRLIETPKDEKYFARVKKEVVVSNERALEAVQAKARELGYQAVICDTALKGEARSVGQTIASVLKQSSTKIALLYGGETTVTIKGAGQGGRNRELALSALPHLPTGTLLLALASDGQDNGPIAGAIVDAETLNKAKVTGASPEKYLLDNDSADFFQTVGDEIKTGPTGINVADLIIALKK